MANKIVEQVLVDTNKRALVKYVFISDGTAASNVTLLDTSTLKYSLNANNAIMVGGVDPKAQYRIAIKSIKGQAKSNGYYALKWASTSNTEIITFTSGNFHYEFDHMGDGAVIPLDGVTPTGDILLSTSGVVSGDTFTIFLDLRKNSEDFDAGQSADPYAFNKRPL